MFFRNITLFRFPAAMVSALDDLDAVLADHPARPVGALEMSTRGFVSPFGSEDASMTHRASDGVWLVLGGEDKILPSSAVNDLANKKIAKLEEAEGRKLSGTARKRIKEEVVHELLPRALSKPSRTGAHLDLQSGLVAIDTSSRKNAENLLTELRKALGSFPAVPVNAEVAPCAVLTGWLAGDALPAGLTLGDECELKDPVERGAVVKASRQDLGAEEIAKHLEAGKQCSRLAMVLDDRLSFVLGDDLVIRKLKFLDGAVESLENTERDSQRAELDARYALMVGELRRLFALLEDAFRITPQESVQQAA